MPPGETLNPTHQSDYFGPKLNGPSIRPVFDLFGSEREAVWWSNLIGFGSERRWRGEAREFEGGLGCCFARLRLPAHPLGSLFLVLQVLIWLFFDVEF